MVKKTAIGVGMVAMLLGGQLWMSERNNNGAPPYVIEDLEPPEIDQYAWIRNWKRPDEPTRVGLQVGHWKNDELPEELDRLIGNTGASGGGKTEIEVNMAIAQETRKILEEKGIVVDILPATIPKSYWADAFVAIHADGNKSPVPSGFKATNPRRDFSDKGEKLLKFIEESYGTTTKMEKDPNISRNMRGYYAFAWWRYAHAVHPRTPSVILETGFLTSPKDRKIIVNNPKLSANGLAEGIIQYLKSEGLN